MNELMVAIPAYNEERSIGPCIMGIRENTPKDMTTFIVVIDDGSTDRTAEIAKVAGADIIIQHDSNHGVGMAIRTAVDYAVQVEAGIVCIIDADMQFDSSEITELIEPIKKSEADLVIGSRFLGSKNDGQIPIFNRVGNQLMALFVSLLIGKRIHDAESGYRAVSLNAARDLNIMGIGSFSHDMLLDLSHKGYTIAEVPVSVRYYNGRTSRVIGRFLKYGFKSLCIVFLKKISLHWNMRFGRVKQTKARVIHTKPG